MSNEKKDEISSDVAMGAGALVGFEAGAAVGAVGTIVTLWTGLLDSHDPRLFNWLAAPVVLALVGAFVGWFLSTQSQKEAPTNDPQQPPVGSIQQGIVNG